MALREAILRRRPIVAAGLALAVLGLAGCGAATTKTGAAAASKAPKLNPAETAAFEIVRLQSIVPFTAAQDQTLEPILSALAKDPNQSASALAAQAKAITAVFTPTQQTAIKNAGLGSVATAGFGGGGFARGGHFSGTPPAGAHFSGTRKFSGTHKFSGTGHFSRTGKGGAGAFGPSLAYTLALDTLEGKTLGRPGGFPGAPGGGSSSSSSGGSTPGGTTAGGTTSTTSA